MFKFLFKTIVVLFVLVVALLLASPLWVGPLARCAANAIAPKYTGTAFHVEDVAFNPYSGRIEVTNLDLPNPEKARVEKAVTLGTFRVRVDPLTVFSDEIVIRELTVRDLYVSYIGYEDPKNPEFKGSNFDWIAENARGGDEAEKEKEPEEEKTEEEEESSRNVVIEKLTISGATLHYGYVSIPIPTITLTDIGKKSEGVKFSDIPIIIIDAIKAVTQGAIDLGGLVGDGILKVGGVAFDMATDAAGAVMDALKNIDLGAVGDKIGEAAGAAMEAVKSIDVDAASAAVQETLGNAASAAKEAAASALESVKDIDLDAAASAAKEAASSALETVKDIDLDAAASAAKEAASSALEAVKGVDLDSAASAAKDAAGSLIEGAGGLLKNAGGLFK